MTPPPPSRLKENEVDIHFPFQVTRFIEEGDADRVDKFSKLMNQACVRAFAVFGPLRCLRSAFSSFQATHKDMNYRGMFQQVFPCFTHLSGIRSRLLDTTTTTSPNNLAEVIPLASSECAECSGGQGRADYVLRTITRKRLDAFKANHPEINWEQEDDVEELACKVFAIIPDRDVRCDAVLDLNTDALTHWNDKTRARLVSHGNQLARQNLKNGFSPRPIYLLAIGATRWRMCILDPMGVIGVDDRRVVTGFREFDEQQKLRERWLSKKDPDSRSVFSKVEPWTQVTLNAWLAEVNVRHMEENTSGVVCKHLVYNLWEENCDRVWNGRGLEDELYSGTLALCEGLLRLSCGDKVCRAGWTVQKLRMLFAKQLERDIARCLMFERVQVQSQRDLNCAFSKEIVRAACLEICAMKPRMSEAAYLGVIESISKVKLYLTSLARRATTSAELLKIGSAYGGEEFLESLDPQTTARIGTSIRYFVVNDGYVEDDAIECFKALVISVATVLPEINWLKDCSVIVCKCMAVLTQFSCKLFQAEYNHLVIFAKDKDEQAISMLQDLQYETHIVIVLEESRLTDIASHFNVKVANSEEMELKDIVGQAKKITTCGNEVCIHCSNSQESIQSSSVLELRVSGASKDHLEERLKCLRTVAAAMTSAAAKGVIPGSGVGFLAAAEVLGESENKEYNVGVGVVKRSLKVVGAGHARASHIARLKAELFKITEVRMEDDFDLLQSAEDTLNQMICITHHIAASAGKRQHPGVLPSPKKARFEKFYSTERRPLSSQDRIDKVINIPS